MRFLAAILALLAACGDNLAGPIGVEDYPAAVREAVCHQLTRCGEIESFETCLTTQLHLTLAFTASQLAAIRADKILYSGAAARACVDGIAGASCDATSPSGRDGNGFAHTSSPIVPPHELSEANDSGSVVSRSAHQRGCRAAFAMVRSVSAGGIVNPLRTSRRRGPATGVSTVSTSAS